LLVDSRDVTREIRRVVWATLRDEGFDEFTGRTAWRHHQEAVDVVNFQSFSASLADAVGCTPYSFSVNLGVWAAGEIEPKVLKPDTKGRPRPAEWRCSRRTRLTKSVEQPWFEPFITLRVSRWPRALRVHRDGLKQIVCRDRHDRDDTWFVFEDGSNLVAMTDDSVRAIRTVGLVWLDAARSDVVRDGLA